MKKFWGILLLVLIISVPSCLFGPSTIRVMSYRNGKVILSNKVPYTVGELPSPWKRFRTGAYAVAFHNPVYGATISTDAFCGPGYDDVNLKTLTNQYIGGVQNFKVEERYPLMLSKRGALRTIATGTADGVPLTFDIVVINKNKCNIDFLCIVPQEFHAQVAGDFEYFYSAFQYE